MLEDLSQRIECFFPLLPAVRIDTCLVQRAGIIVSRQVIWLDVLKRLGELGYLIRAEQTGRWEVGRRGREASG